MLSMPSGAPCDASTSNIGADCGRDLDLDFALLELSVEQQLLELVARALVALLRRIDLSL